MSIIPFDPATIVEIKIGDLSAPVRVGTEMSKLYLASDEIVRKLINDIITDSDSGITLIPPDLLPWFKEQRMLLTEIHKMTGEVEQKVEMKRMELQAELFKHVIKNLPPDKKIMLLKALKINANNKSDS